MARHGAGELLLLFAVLSGVRQGSVLSLMFLVWWWMVFWRVWFEVGKVQDLGVSVLTVWHVGWSTTWPCRCYHQQFLDFSRCSKSARDFFARIHWSSTSRISAVTIFRPKLTTRYMYNEREFVLWRRLVLWDADLSCNSRELTPVIERVRKLKRLTGDTIRRLRLQISTHPFPRAALSKHFRWPQVCVNEVFIPLEYWGAGTIRSKELDQTLPRRPEVGKGLATRD